jgi:hypothetical protein
MRPYQGFGDIRLWEFEAYSDYKALQATVSRRFSKGLMFSFNYSRSEAKGTLGGEWGQVWKIYFSLPLPTYATTMRLSDLSNARFTGSSGESRTVKT